MNEKTLDLPLRDFMDRPDGWGRTEGREVYNRLIAFVEAHPGTLVFRVSVKGVARVDISFASETIVELARRYRGSKGFCFVDLVEADLVENWDAAAAKKSQPLLLWRGKHRRVIGVAPSEGNREAFEFATARVQSRAAEFARATGITTANASMKFKQLWEQGFLLRRDGLSETGGVEFDYCRIG